MIKQTIKKIDPNADYGLQDIQVKGLLPWARDIRTIRKYITADIAKENILKAKTEGSGRLLRYHIKGRNLITFIEVYGPGAMAASQHNGKNNKAGFSGGVRKEDRDVRV